MGEHGGQRNRAKRLLAACVALVALLAIVPQRVAAQGTPPVTPTLDLMVTPELRDELWQILGLDERQVVRANECHARYSAAIEALSLTTRQKALDAGLSEVEKANTIAAEKGQPVEWNDRLETLMRDSRKVLIEGQRASDGMLQSFLDCLAYGIPLDEDRIDDVAKRIRRANYLQRSNQNTDFIANIDLVHLVQSAMKSDGELSAIEVAKCADGSAASVELDAIVNDYVEVVDAILLQRITRRRNPQSTVAHVTSDNDAFIRKTRDWSADFRRMYAAVSSTSERIHALAADSLSSQAAMQWQSRVDHALCPRLSLPRWPHKMLQWLDSTGSATPDQRESVGTLQATFDTRYEQRLHDAIVAGTKVKADHFTPETSIGSDSLDRAYAMALLECHELSHSTIQSLCLLLTPAQHTSLKQTFERVTPEMFGPTIPVVLRKYLDSESDYRPTLEQLLKGKQVGWVEPRESSRSLRAHRETHRLSGVVRLTANGGFRSPGRPLPTLLAPLARKVEPSLA